jgi:hypothetical protein
LNAPSGVNPTWGIACSRIPPGGSDRAGPYAALYLTSTRLRNIFRKLRFCVCLWQNNRMELQMNGLIYLIGLIVVVMVLLSLLGLR